MPVVTVNLLDTFDQWRLKTNDIGANLGDLVNLNTTDKTNIVAAINEVVSGDSDDMENLIDDTTPQLGGDLDLNTHNITGIGNINTTGALIVSGNVTAAQYSGTLNQTVTGVTQSPNDNSLKIATTEYVDAQVATENTLEEMDDTNITSPQAFDVIQWDGVEWVNRNFASAGLLSNVVEDTTPQLGGNLDLNSFQIEGTGNVIINGTVQATNIVGPVSGAVEVVTDVSPQLGGDLDLNSQDITGTGNINITGSLTATSIAGTVLGVTQSAGDNSTKLATTAYADNAATSAAAVVESSGLVFAVALG